jgi:hypothetical protein
VSSAWATVQLVQLNNIFQPVEFSWDLPTEPTEPNRFEPVEPVCFHPLDQ